MSFSEAYLNASVDNIYGQNVGVEDAELGALDDYETRMDDFDVASDIDTSLEACGAVADGDFVISDDEAASIEGDLECPDGGGFATTFSDGSRLVMDADSSMVTYTFGDEKEEIILAGAAELRPKLRRKFALLSKLIQSAPH